MASLQVPAAFDSIQIDLKILVKNLKSHTIMMFITFHWFRAGGGALGVVTDMYTLFDSR